MLNIFNFKDTKKVDHILENSFFFDEIYVIYQLSEIKDDIRKSSLNSYVYWDTLY